MLNFLSRMAIATVLAVMGAQAASAGQITITAGSPGGGYFKAAAALAEYIKADIPGTQTTVIPGGGWGNIERLQTGLADIAVVENALASMAYKGNSPNHKKYDFRMLASFRGPNIGQAAIVNSAGIKNFEDIRKKKFPLRVVMISPPSSIISTIAVDVMAAYGITEEAVKSWGGKFVYTSQNDGFNMLMDGRADMFFLGAGYYPHSKYVQLGTKKAFTLLPISKEVAEKVANKYGLSVVKVPADIYKNTNGSNVAYWSQSLVVDFAVRKDMPDDLVYAVAKAFAHHKAEFWKVAKQHKFYDPSVAWKNVGSVPLHPGAARFYKEMGYMK
jgi:uncharacterized protein